MFQEELVQVRRYAEIVQGFGIAIVDFQAERPQGGGEDASAGAGPVVAGRVPASGAVAVTVAEPSLMRLSLAS